jgi:hypothetical protein
MFEDVLAFVNDNDLSVHFERVPSGNSLVLRVVANSLADLTLRKHRFCHDPLVFESVASPGQFVFAQGPQPNSVADPLFPDMLNIDIVVRPAGAFRAALALRRSWLIRARSNSEVDRTVSVGRGEDVMLASLLAFDVRAFDPLATLSGTSATPGPSDEVLGPGDRGYAAGGSVTLPVGRGAYVDLNFHEKYGITGYTPAQPVPHFALGNAALSRLSDVRSGTYDTWPFVFETDGLNQNGNSVPNSTPQVPLVDEGTNGLDDNNNGIVDDEAERETSPPYRNPLRGIQAWIRVLDPSTRQVLQATVTSNFVPE